MKFETIAERLHSTDRAVSPVIGVILMVAITVILAAVIGTFVLDLGQSAGQSAPQASLSVSTDVGDDSISVSHQGGDGLEDSRTRVSLTNETSGNSSTFSAGTGSDLFAVGQELTISASTDPPTTSGVEWTDRTGDAVGVTMGINQGHRYTVQIVDTESQRVVWETTVTA